MTWMRVGGRANLMLKVKGHWERKCKNRFWSIIIVFKAKSIYVKPRHKLSTTHFTSSLSSKTFHQRKRVIFDICAFVNNRLLLIAGAPHVHLAWHTDSTPRIMMHDC